MRILNTNEKIKEREKERGQTLLFVVVAVTIALAIGISVSTRTLSSLKRVSRVDTSSRAVAAAEGGIENLLSKNYDELDTAKTPSADNCSAIGATYHSTLGKCVYVFEKGAGDDIESRALVTVDTFNYNDGDNYSFNLDPDSVKEVHLSGYSSTTVKICWDNIENSAIYYYSYNSSGVIEKGGVYSSSLKSEYNPSSNISGFDQVSGNCKDNVSLVSSPYGIRIRVLYNSSKVSVYPAAICSGGSCNLPTQGYKLTSRGDIMYGGNVQPETATVVVYKSYPYASSVFDYGIYTSGVLQ